MRNFLFAALLALGACTMTPAQQAAVGPAVTQATATLDAAAVQLAKVACQVDGALQPLAAATVQAVAGVYGTAVVSVDELLVHPAVVAACANVGGVPAVSP